MSNFLFEDSRIKKFETRPLEMIYMDKINITSISISKMVYYQKILSKAVWRPSPGRNLAFIVSHDKNLIGLIFLSSPVITLNVRDSFLKLDKNPVKRGKELRCYMDVSVCVGIQPLAWHWNIGKLCAMLACTLKDEIEIKYPEDECKGLTTTSLYGHGSQYNRIYKFLGYTKGFGHEHVDDKKYIIMKNWLKNNNTDLTKLTKTNKRMQIIQKYGKLNNEKDVVFHGNKRGVYYHDIIPTNKRTNIILDWYNRWGLPRYNKTKELQPPYLTGKE